MVNFLDWGFMESKSRREKPKFMHGGFLINRKINATIVFYYESTLFYSTISHFDFSEPTNRQNYGIYLYGLQ